MSDTADGLWSHRPPARALEIMKDSRIGAMGVIALVMVLAIKWAGIMALADHRSLLLLIVPALARGSVLFAVRWLPYGRPQGGLGHPFCQAGLAPTAFAGLLLPAGLALLLGRQALILLPAYGLVVLALLGWYHRRLGCITGDMMGAMIEITEAALWLIAAAGVLS